MSSGLTNTQVRSVCVQGGNLFVGTYLGGVFKSTDGGANWNAANNGLPGGNSTYSLTANSQLVFAGTSNGTFFSVNSGSSWIYSGSGMQGYAQCLVIKGTNIFAGTDNWGVFSQPLSSLLTGMNEVNDVSNIQIFPDPFITQTTLYSSETFKNARLTVYNLLGQVMKEIKNISGNSFTITRDDLACGIYFIHVRESDKIIAVKKLVIAD
jgi:hypothetical protein